MRTFKYRDGTTPRMDDTLEARVRALERTVTDGEYELTELTEEAAARERLEDLETETADLADRVAELEAATQALRGYVGNIRAVNQDVEQRADAALAKAESIEERMGTSQGMPDPAAGGHHKAASADGGHVRNDSDGDHCDACGRGPEREPTDRPETGQVSRAERVEGGEETLVPETSETGTLRRIRELL